MFEDKNFRFIDRRVTSECYGGNLDIKVRNGVMSYGFENEDANFTVMDYDRYGSSLGNFIFYCYKIPFNNRVNAIPVEKEQAYYFLEHYSDEIIIFDINESYIMWHSDICSESLLTTMALFGLQ